MNCKDLRNRLYEYFEGTLPASERAEVDRHGSECPNCGKLLEQCAELTCRDLLDFIDDYVEGLLAKSVREVFERHLAVCSQCVDYLDGYRKTIGAVRALRGDKRTLPPAELPPELISAILAARRAAHR